MAALNLDRAPRDLVESMGRSAARGMAPDFTLSDPIRMQWFGDAMAHECDYLRAMGYVGFPRSKPTTKPTFLRRFSDWWLRRGNRLMAM
jgi:hypothetical protein